MKLIIKFWQKFSGFARSREARKNEPDIWFFYGFLLTFTLSIRKIIYFYPIKGNFNEYLAISLYLSDIFLFLILFSWVLSILCNKYSNMSMVKSSIHSLYSKKVWITCWEWLKCSTWNIFKSKLILIPLIFILWAFISILWSDNKIVAFYRSLKLLEFFLLYVYIIYKCSTRLDSPRLLVDARRAWNICRISLFIIIFVGLSQALIEIWQFIVQHSLGLFWLKESLISPEILGVAKVIFGSQKYIRAYGLFPHPNILGSFLLVSIILTLLYRKLFHVEHFKSCHSGLACPAVAVDPESNKILMPVQNEMKCSTWNILKDIIARNVPRGTFWYVILSIQLIALTLTFSKSAILGLIIAFGYIFINQYRNVPPHKVLDCSTPAPWNVPRGTFSTGWNNSILYGVKHSKRYFTISLLIFGSLLFYFKIDFYSLFLKSLEERFIYLAISIKAIVSHIVLGLGNGQFVLEMQKYASRSLEFWQFQPIHNVFLLILAELGIIGLFLFIWFLLELFHVEQFDDTCHSERSEESQVKNKRSFANAQDDGVSESILNNINHILSSSLISTYFKAILLGFIFIMLFDHYFWDIQQGQIMFWMIMGFVAGLNKKD